MQFSTDEKLDIRQREPLTVSRTHYCIVGDVSVDTSAAIAPGVVLQALPGSRIIIGRGVCIAGGVCIQAKSGILTIAPGVTLGANVLIVGSGQIGTNACISPGSTVMNPRVAEGALLPPNTLSDASTRKPGESPTQNSFSQSKVAQNSFSQNGANQSRSSSVPDISNQPLPSNTFVEPGPIEAKPIQIPSINANSAPVQNSSPYQQRQSSFAPDISNQPLPNNTFVEPGPIEAKPIQIPSIDVSATPVGYDPSKNGVQLNQNYDLSSGNGQSSAITAPSHDRVYGRDQVSQLMSTLFPNRQSLNG